jgi:hypothetical protein
MQFVDKVPKEIPTGKILVHNGVVPTKGDPKHWRSGQSGFRFWFDSPSANYEVCPCGWAPNLPEHYITALVAGLRRK